MELDGEGGCKKVDPLKFKEPKRSNKVLWIDFDHTDIAARDWIRKHIEIVDVPLMKMMSALETRPRSLLHHDKFFLILRGMNYNPSADPDDMVSLRIFIGEHIILTAHKRALNSVTEMLKQYKANTGPDDIGGFLVGLANFVTDGISEFVCKLDDDIDVVEDQLENSKPREIRPKVAEIRRQTIKLRRYLIPQRDALTRIQSDKISWLEDSDRVQLREASDSTIRLIEDLDAAKDRTTVTQETIMDRTSEELNSRMYVLSVVAVIFMPLSFVTGLLGINVAGIPGSTYKLAFLIVCVALGLLGLFEIWFLKFKKWM